MHIKRKKEIRKKLKRKKRILTFFDYKLIFTTISKNIFENHFILQIINVKTKKISDIYSLRASWSTDRGVAMESILT